MTTQHTPGPWAVTTVGSCHGIHPAASDNERDDICRITPHNYHPDGWQAAKGEAEANARLISAAPDLLVALREAVEIIEGTGLDASVQRAAIAKATEVAA